METKMDFPEFIKKAEELQDIAKTQGYNLICITEQDDKAQEHIETHGLVNVSESAQASPLFNLVHKIMVNAKDIDGLPSDENQIEMDLFPGPSDYN
jgi:hypothetical protein